MEPRHRRRILVAETVTLERQTLSALLDTISSLFSKKEKPSRILYQKGEDLKVETYRLIDVPEVEVDSGLVTPYQVIRQHCELDILEVDRDPAIFLCNTVSKLRGACFPTGIVVQNTEVLSDWVPQIDASAVFGIPVYVDPDTPDNFIFICGSSLGPMIQDFEKAFAFRTLRS